MERVLKPAGVILAALLVPVTALQMVVAQLGSAVAPASDVPATVHRILSDEDFYDDVVSAILASLMDKFPDELHVGDATLTKAALIDGFRNANWETVARDLIPREWVEAQLAIALGRVIDGENASTSGELEQDFTLIQSQLAGERGQKIADFVLMAAPACTSGQVQQLLAVAQAREGLTTPPIITFICNPGPDVEIDLHQVMRDLVIVALADLAEQLVSDIGNPFADIELSHVSITTSVGELSFVWPVFNLTRDPFTITYTLPEDVQQAIEEPIIEMRESVRDAVETANTAVEESQANLDALESAISTAPTATVRATAAVTATPLPTATVQATSTTSPPDNEKESTLGQTVVTTAIQQSSQDDDGTTIASRINSALAITCSVPLLVLTIGALFLLRTWRSWLTWIGAVLLTSGVALVVTRGVLLSAVDTFLSNVTHQDLSENVQRLQDTLLDAIAVAVSLQIGDTLLVRGIGFSVAGVVLIGLIILEHQGMLVPLRYRKSK